ncbi:hypothetical protein BATDEDRAFT_22613 [Batrachochytrium dendrobatidis JAM81]|uniref:Uncharacterized protein n=1 Tax=Batrachochytrium dendrobatidis (strain JAM81 / FGSC 10211) TaxID=684364 RepID=F4NVN0_BATDJ|nr:uncharacterized protein BATDEDRAFT_22613 [Batrachochytrium dendrobatidis JAM81]EGF83712.1 hypothetical protein BATDEDRAFT_22613 [Batrachochytrium dendrobatidis JAM81]|eukprot:XP_006675618.1 hypothetical protein BATDEDRAFT_22613 [Batrachochytrium dendrobatidis JAM81]
MCIIAYNMVWYRFRHRGLGQIMTETKQTPYREVCVEGEWDGWGSGKCPRMMSKDTVSKDHVRKTWCPKTWCPKATSRGLEDRREDHVQMDHVQMDHVQMSKWTRGPRPKVMAFLNDKLTQCLYKTMLKQQHCTSQGQTVMN